jgi:putative transposase
MSDAYAISQSGGTYFLTNTVIKWIDVFTREKFRNIILDTWSFCRKHKHLELHAYVVMTNHLHWIGSCPDNVSMADIVRDFKKFTASAILKELQSLNSDSRSEWMLKLFGEAGKSSSVNTKFQFWQNNNHATVIYSPSVFVEKLKYIHDNPVRAGFVSKPEDWLCSSAKDYIGEKGVIEIDPVIPKVFVK